jgi:hypothetical protein
VPALPVVLVAPQPMMFIEAVPATSTSTATVSSSSSTAEASPASIAVADQATPTASTNNRNRNAVAVTQTASAPQAVTTFAKSGLTVTMVNPVSAQASGVVNVAIPKEMAAPGSAFAFPLPSKAVTTADTNSNQVQVRLPNGNPLPAWLNYNAQTRVITASAVPDGALPMQVTVNAAGNMTTVVIAPKP